MKLVKLLFGLVFLLIINLSLIGCKSKKNNDEVITPVRELYKTGLDLLDKQKYNQASEAFGQVFFQHPGDRLSPQAQLMQAYCSFLDKKYLDAVDILNIFVKLYPLHEDIEYAYYLKGLALYMDVSEVRLDQTSTLEGKVTFEEFIAQFPNSKYTKDAIEKLAILNAHIDGKEMDIGRYYLSKNDPIPSITRYQSILNKSPNSLHRNEALYRMIEICLMLGLKEEMQQYLAMLNKTNDMTWIKAAEDLLSAKTIVKKPIKKSQGKSYKKENIN